MLTIYTNLTQVEIPCIKMKLKNLTWCENNPLQSISKSEQTRTSRKIALALNHMACFLKLPKQNGTNHLIFQSGFPVFPFKMVSGFCRIMLFYGFLVKSLNIYTFVLMCIRLRGWVIEYKLGKNPANCLLRNYEDKINSK